MFHLCIIVLWLVPLLNKFNLFNESENHGFYYVMYEKQLY